jgi:hypothetical protein
MPWSAISPKESFRWSKFTFASARPIVKLFTSWSDTTPMHIAVTTTSRLRRRWAFEIRRRRSPVPTSDRMRQWGGNQKRDVSLCPSEPRRLASCPVSLTHPLYPLPHPLPRGGLVAPTDGPNAAALFSAPRRPASAQTQATALNFHSGLGHSRPWALNLRQPWSRLTRLHRHLLAWSLIDCSP